MIYHRCSRCGKRVETGKKCDCVNRIRHREYDRASRDKEAKKFYHSRAWVMLRQKVMNDCDGIDLFELYVYNRVRHADTVHHIVPIEDDKSKGLDEMNLIPVSSSNHNVIHAEYDKGGQYKENMQRLLRRARLDYQA